MAQTTLGIDLGSYSVKAVLVESTLKRQTVKAFREIHLTRRTKPMPDNEELAAVARTLADDPAFKATTVVLGLPGFATLKKWLEFPFNDRKKIDGTIGFPFSDLVPVAFQDYVIDYHVAGRTDAGQWQLLAVAAEREQLRGILEAFRSAGIDPRFVVPGGLGWLNLVDQISTEGSGCTAIVDVGYQSTEVLVFEDGVLRTYRTVLAGTARLADAVSKLLQKPLAEAQGIAESVAEVVPEGREAAGDLGQVQRVLRDQVDGLLGEVGLALRSVRIERGRAPDRVLLAGGVMRLAGVEERAELQLGVPVRRFEPRVDWSSGTAPLSALPSIGRALALAFSPQGRGAGLDTNLRKGEFEYRGAYEFLKGTVGALGVFLALFVLIAGVKTWLDHRVLQEQYDTMVADLGQITEKYLGQSVDDFDTALKLLQKGTIADLSEAIPEEDMYDLMVRVTDVQARMNDKLASELLPAAALPVPVPEKPVEPPPEGDEGAGEVGAAAPDEAGGAPPATETDEKVFVEVYDLQLDRKSVRLRAETNSVDAMEVFLAQLKKVSCLHHVLLENSDRISFKRHSGWRRFQVSATYECKASDKDKDKDKAEKDGEKTEGAGTEKAGPPAPAGAEPPGPKAVVPPGPEGEAPTMRPPTIGVPPTLQPPPDEGPMLPNDLPLPGQPAPLPGGEP